MSENGSSVADLFQAQFSDEGAALSLVEKHAEELLGGSIDQMSDEEVAVKLAQIEEQESLVKVAELDYARGQFMAQGFIDRLNDEGIDLPGLHEKVAEITNKLKGG